MSVDHTQPPCMNAEYSLQLNDPSNGKLLSFKICALFIPKKHFFFSKKWSHKLILCINTKSISLQKRPPNILSYYHKKRYKKRRMHDKYLVFFPFQTISVSQMTRKDTVTSYCTSPEKPSNWSPRTSSSRILFRRWARSLEARSGSIQLSSSPFPSRIRSAATRFAFLPFGNLACLCLWSSSNPESMKTLESKF